MGEDADIVVAPPPVRMIEYAPSGISRFPVSNVVAPSQPMRFNSFSAMRSVGESFLFPVIETCGEVCRSESFSHRL